MLEAIRPRGFALACAGILCTTGAPALASTLYDCDEEAPEFPCWVETEVGHVPVSV